MLANRADPAICAETSSDDIIAWIDDEIRLTNHGPSIKVFTHLQWPKGGTSGEEVFVDRIVFADALQLP